MSKINGNTETILAQEKLREEECVRGGGRHIEDESEEEAEKRLTSQWHCERKGDKVLSTKKEKGCQSC